MSQAVEELIEKGAWEDARRLIERQLVREPNNHWLLTQQGVTLYEQGLYREALKSLRESYDIVQDCPLTLWNLAGVMDALGKPKIAASIYTWIVNCPTSIDDPCWESIEWAEALKADCHYRLGRCLEYTGDRKVATDYYRRYVWLVTSGVGGMYPIEDARRRIRELSKPRRSLADSATLAGAAS